jgi:hypothetical protein
MSSIARIPRRAQRSMRVKLGGSILALVLLENGRQIRARLSQLSVNGGLLSLENPLDEGIRVTVLFHLGITSVRCRAQMMFPMWATQGCLQPCRFLELEEESRASLTRELGSLVRSGAPEIEEEPEQSSEGSSEAGSAEAGSSEERSSAAVAQPALEESSELLEEHPAEVSSEPASEQSAE